MCKKMIETGSKTDDAKVKVAYDVVSDSVHKAGPLC